MVRSIYLAGLLLIAAACDRPSNGRPFERSENGRYQIVTSPLSMKDTMLVDTRTGKVWQNVTYIDVEGNPSVWKEMYRFDNHVAFDTAHPLKGATVNEHENKVNESPLRLNAKTPDLLERLADLNEDDLDNVLNNATDEQLNTLLQRATDRLAERQRKKATND